MIDRLLIEGLVRRDKSVFDYIFHYYYSSLCAFAMQYLRSRSDAEDIVQDFFVSFWMEAPAIRISSSLKSYLFTGVRNKCLDYRKHQKVIQQYRAYVFSSSEGCDNLTECYFAESELRQFISKSLEKLTPRCREIFELSRLKGLSNKDISVKLGISKRTVELQISKSLKVLRKELVEYLPLYIITWLIV